MSNEKLKLLIVEDDSENQKLLTMILKNHYDTDLCDSADSFYEKINEKDFDVILMDISLRGFKDGLQLTTEMRANPKYQNIPIIALSAHAFQRDRDNAYKAGVDLFLTKPIQNRFLLDSLKKILEQKRSNISE